MYKLFEKRSLFAYIVLFLLFGILATNIFQCDYKALVFDDSFIFKNILKIQNWSNLIIQFLVFLLFVIFVFLIMMICKHFSFTGKNILIIQVLFIVNCIFALYFENSLTSIIELLFVLLFLLFFVNSDKKTQTVNLFFNIGFTFGISLFISLKLLIFLPILFFSANIYGKNGFYDLFSFLFGLIVPLYLIYSYLYLTDNQQFFYQYLNSINKLKYDIIHGKEILIFCQFILCAFMTLPVIANFNINTRKLYTVLLSMFFILTPFYIFLSFGEEKSYLILSLIATLYLSAFISTSRNIKLKNIILFSGFIMAIVVTFIK